MSIRLGLLTTVARRPRLVHSQPPCIRHYSSVQPRSPRARIVYIGGIATLTATAYVQWHNKVERDNERLHREDKAYISGPWQVQVAAALPLKAISRLWGRFNNMTIPEPLRVPGFRLYSWLFGCNLDEMAEPDLRKYPNLAAFFYRPLKDGVRPIQQGLVSPADGTILHVGLVHERQIEQVKGLTYSLDALIGHDAESAQPSTLHPVTQDEFAEVNGIPYGLDDMIGTNAQQVESSVGKDATPAHLRGSNDPRFKTVASNTTLYYCVIYLAPGDYHRFHSPTDWVVEKRRHFAGELFSVSPYFVKLLADLFVLNERVVLLGRWRYGFFSMTPVGATNVGSIKINFDEALRTNEKEALAGGTYTEVSFQSAGPQLGGKLARKGEELGGFELGSTIVLCFEAPQDFQFSIESGQKIKVGETLGMIL
ncbi:hypothetical protein BZG36_03647 [Bifiguratus adelaidae]|uniref:Phosphatidylserine decarboxylase proenzyme 1, mitochondrial n=1 Tax=Bifiguratus adelaidae TaxID=1938954 RepID=A0A261XWA1_9FUNG|nr:hypothetical protein BZG36_03647 [Bifiguratus adelaidae]